MKKSIVLSKAVIFALAVMLLFTSCEDEGPAPTPGPPGSITILPLGDSRVEGFRPEHESYRYELWKNLVNDNWEVDFIGTRRDDADYPDVSGKNFDREHEGTGGATTVSLLETLGEVSFQRKPDIALLGIGGNDVTDAGLTISQVIANIRLIVADIRSRNDSVSIFIEQIAPGTTDFMTAEFTSLMNEFNQEVPALVSELSTSASPIYAVNMNRDWSDAYMADAVHYNSTGAKVVADRYFDAIKANFLK